MASEIGSINTSFELETDADGGRSLKNKSPLKDLQEKIAHENNAIKKQLNPLLERDKMRDEIEILNKSISNDKKSLSDIKILSNSIEEKKKQLDTSKEKLFKIYDDTYQQYQSVITELKTRTIELEKDSLSIQGMVRFNFPKLREEIYAISDGRPASYRNYGILNESKKGTDDLVYEEFIKEIKQIFNDIIDSKYVLRNKIPLISGIKIALDDFFFDDWVITYKGDRLGEMSSGKASFVILMLIRVC